MIGRLHHLLIIPILVPLLIGALQLFLTQRRGIRITCALGSVLIQAGAALTLLYLTTDSMPHMWTEGVGVYAIGSWPAPFGIVLVVDRLAALMLVLTSHGRARRVGVLTGLLGPRRARLPLAVPVSADGLEWRVPDRRSVQPVRILRDPACILLWAAPARFGRRGA